MADLLIRDVPLATLEAIRARAAQNARRKTVRSGNEAPAVSEIVRFLKRVGIMPSIAYGQAAARLAERLDRRIDDCFCVVMARERTTLLTSDMRLARKLRSHKFGSVVVTT
jgi:predicted nucleic acid-binding protein